MTIDEYIAGKDIYRVAAGNDIAEPQPISSSRPSKEAETLYSRHATDVDSILAKHHIRNRDIRVQAIGSRGYGRANETDTLVITTRDADVSEWKTAATEIQSLLQRQPRVEIRNDDLMYCDVSKVIRPETQASQALEFLAPFVGAEVGKLLPGVWTSVAYHGRIPQGQTGLEGLKATVLIGVKPGASNLWTPIEQKIQDCIRSKITAFPDVEIYTEIVPCLIG